MTGLLVFLGILNPARAPRPDTRRREDEPPEPELPLSPGSFMFFTIRAPYWTMASKAIWTYRNTQAKTSTVELEVAIVMVVVEQMRRAHAQIERGGDGQHALEGVQNGCL